MAIYGQDGSWWEEECDAIFFQGLVILRKRPSQVTLSWLIILVLCFHENIDNDPALCKCVKIYINSRQDDVI